MTTLILILTVLWIGDGWAKSSFRGLPYKEQVPLDEAVSFNIGPGNPPTEAFTTLTTSWTCGCYALVCEHPNFQRRNIKIREQNANFRDKFFDNQVDSMEVYGNRRSLFYENPIILGNTHLVNSPYHNSAPSWGGSGYRVLVMFLILVASLWCEMMLEFS